MNTDGFGDAPSGDTYLRTSGMWIQSDPFDSDNYYTSGVIDNMISEFAYTSAVNELSATVEYNTSNIYTISGSLEQHISATKNPHQTSYLNLTDTEDNSYIGRAGYNVTVNSAEDGLVFARDDNTDNIAAAPYIYRSFDGSAPTQGEVRPNDNLHSNVTKLLVSYKDSKGLNKKDGLSAITKGDFLSITTQTAFANYQVISSTDVTDYIDFDVTPLSNDGTFTDNKDVQLELLFRGVSNFDGLTDTPSSKVGYAGQIIAVNSSESSLEYIDMPDSFPEAPISSTYLRTSGSWVPSDTFNAGDYYISAIIDNLLDNKEDKLSYGTSGQIMATNDNSDGYDWVDSPLNTDETVKIDANDASSGYLDDKLLVDGCITKTVVNTTVGGCPVGKTFFTIPETVVDPDDFTQPVPSHTNTDIILECVWEFDGESVSIQHIKDTSNLVKFYFSGDNVYSNGDTVTDPRWGVRPLKTKITYRFDSDSHLTTIAENLTDTTCLPIIVNVPDNEIPSGYDADYAIFARRYNGGFLYRSELFVSGDGLPNDCQGEITSKQLQISCDPSLIDLGIDDLSDVDTSTNTPIENDLLKWDGAGDWIPTSIDSIPSLNVVNFVKAGGVNDDVILEIHSAFNNISGFVIPSATYETRIKGIKIKSSYAHHDSNNDVNVSLRLSTLPFNQHNLYVDGDGNTVYENDNAIPISINGNRYHFVQTVDDNLDVLLPEDSILFCELHPKFWAFADLEVTIIYSLVRV